MEGNDFLSIHQLNHVALHLGTTYFFLRMERKSYLQRNAAHHASTHCGEGALGRVGSSLLKEKGPLRLKVTYEGCYSLVYDPRFWGRLRKRKLTCVNEVARRLQTIGR